MADAAKYILVTGGSFINKGAQAMTFITADQMAKRFPGCQVVLLSHYEARLPEEEKRKYRIKFMPFPRKMHRFKLRLHIRDEYTELFKNAVALLDISGYRLGSNWGISSMKGYLNKIELAQHFGIPVYLMPQSFGPFELHGIKSWGLFSRIRRTLSCVKVIMAREQESYRQLVDVFKLDNVVLTPDLVLQSEEVAPENIYTSQYVPVCLDVPAGSVAVIPNSRNFEYGSKDAILDLYRHAIGKLLADGRHVYLVAHSTEDVNVCKDLKRLFAADNDNVVLVEQDFNCLDFCGFVRQFDFVIASRFHSIVHAYREKVPALIVGWANKYKELSINLSQEKYFYDVRKGLDAKEILDALDCLENNHQEESRKIAEALEALKEKNVYEYIELKRD